MCTHQRWITNKYTGRSFLVNCGKCEACVQQKAVARTNRIRNHAAANSDRLPLFVTLTYDRSSCPFILHEDIKNKVDILPVYRDHFTRRKRCLDGVYRDKRVYKRTLLGRIYFADYWDSDRYIPYLKHRRGKIGVCFMKDAQDFHKRLRINLERNYNYTYGYTYYQTFEYGETTFRPHIHLLIYIRPDDEAIFREAIVKSWPFADKRRTEKFIEFERSTAAAYVASYVNSGSNFSTFLAHNFAPKHSHSKLFGHGLASFSLPSLLQAADRGLMQYYVETNRDGVQQVLHLPIPKYVINRYFPIFKGYSRLTSSEISFVLSNCKGYSDLRRFQGNDVRINIPAVELAKVHCDYTDLLGHILFSLEKSENTIFSYVLNSRYRDARNLDLSDDDVRRYNIRLLNCFSTYNKITGRNIFDYAIDFDRIWRCYKSTMIRMSLEDDTFNVAYKYDNIRELYDCPGLQPGLYKMIMNDTCQKIIDPNEFPQVVNKTNRLIMAHHSYLKTKKVNNIVLSQMYDEF